jgi:hypothetical protein
MRDRGQRLSAADYERTIPVDPEDSDWWMRRGLQASDGALRIQAPYLMAARDAEDVREIRTGRLMR